MRIEFNTLFGVVLEQLICKHLTKKYGKGAKALDNVSFFIPSSGIFALIGRNGAGKTTLIRILSTELMPTSGHASINGIDVVSNSKGIRESIAILPQESRAIPWLTPRQTVFSYLLYRGFSFKEANKLASKALSRLHLGRYADTLNRMLSGGTKRKVLVATIIASGSKILFIDEPTTGLDPLSRSDLWKILKELKKDHFIFLTTHYLEEAERLADQIGILEKGKLLGTGSLQELRRMVGYEYSIRLSDNSEKVYVKEGKRIEGLDGSMQILTNGHEADRIASRLIKNHTKFSINPTSLEDIFYYIVRKPIYAGNEEGEDEEE
jgi:ABC-2 type transport system ATP-binding protein